MEMKFFKCNKCGNIIAVIKESGVSVMCCGEKMQEIIPGSVDAAIEKHVPVYEMQDGKVIVKIGSVDHPMTDEHYIEWVALKTSSGNQRKALKPGMKPEVCFYIAPDDKVEAVFAYCNLHGLWKS